MERETSDFDDWFRTVATELEDSGLVDSLNRIALFASRDFGVRLWFVEILGRRWSYVAGEMPERPARRDVRRIELAGGIGLVSNSWERLSEAYRARLVEFLNRLISERSAASRAAFPGSP